MSTESPQEKRVRRRSSRVGKSVGRTVRRDDDLFVGLIKVVEDVEERFLRRLFSAEELYVVNHQNVAGAVFLAETVAVLVVAAADDADELVYHRFAVGIDDFGFR